MRILAAVGLMALVAGCGADGAPIRPSIDTQIKVGPDGISADTDLSVSAGILTIGLGL